jgi:A/G-specific adenine glycosylase
MLQQTTVAMVTPRFKVFMKQFPSFRRLSEATVQDVIAAWKGLGYNRRALALLESARTITRERHGRLPRSVDGLIELPGVGRATAAAVIVYAFDLPQAFIEANIRRVFLHFFFPGRGGVPDTDILPLVEQTMDKENPRDWFYALMDYGAFLAAGSAGKPGARASQRSSRYRRQAAFEGSIRQLRGRVLSVLIARLQATRAQIEKEIGSEERLPEALSQLVKEGFLKLERGRYSFR